MANELAFGASTGEVEFGDEEIRSLLKILEGVPSDGLANLRGIRRHRSSLFNLGEEGGIERVRFAKLGDVLSLEDVDILVVMEIDKHQT